jgi:hypothetical protein
MIAHQELELPLSELLKTHFLSHQERLAVIAKQPQAVTELRNSTPFSELQDRMLAQESRGNFITSKTPYEALNELRLIGDAAPKEHRLFEKDNPSSQYFRLEVQPNGRIGFEGQPVSFDAEQIIAACLANEKQGEVARFVYPYLDVENKIAASTPIELQPHTLKILFKTALAVFTSRNQYLFSNDQFRNINTEPETKIQLEKTEYTWLITRFNQIGDMIYLVDLTQELRAPLDTLPLNDLMIGLERPAGERQVQAFKTTLRVLSQPPYKAFLDYLDIEERFKDFRPRKMAEKPLVAFVPITPRQEIIRKAPEPQRPTVSLPPVETPTTQPEKAPPTIRDVNINLGKEPHLTDPAILQRGETAVRSILSIRESLKQKLINKTPSADARQQAINDMTQEMSAIFLSLPNEVDAVRISFDNKPLVLFNKKNSNKDKPFIITIEQVTQIHEALKPYVR